MLYPEHDKLKVFSEEQISAINEFIEFLEQHFQLERFVDNGFEHAKFQEAFYEMLNVNPKILELERKKMLNK